ncbi:hypothetical protein T05_1255 [Trichinella murrelli]|uniref:Uncharacterized protein n=1 Tax=Trichinella murrelli TaxID=144512 RepID=A0A0V0TQF1_9BILA|nr:hypothetical protein T05_1255 [Trichinella murrelli]
MRRIGTVTLSDLKESVIDLPKQLSEQLSSVLQGLRHLIILLAPGGGMVQCRWIIEDTILHCEIRGLHHEIYWRAERQKSGQAGNTKDEADRYRVSSTLKGHSSSITVCVHSVTQTAPMQAGADGS